MKRLLLTLAATFGLMAVAVADERHVPALEGTWLPERFQVGPGELTSAVWTSVLTVKGDTFSLTEVYKSKEPVTGRFTLDPAGSTIDFAADEFKLTAFGPTMTLPKATYPGRYRLEGDVLTVAVELELDTPRPEGFQPTKKKSAVLTLRRAPTSFAGYPKEVAVRAVGADGRPVAGATAFTYMQQNKYESQLLDKAGKPFKVNLQTLTAKDHKELFDRLPDQLKESLKSVRPLPEGTVVDRGTGWCYYGVTPPGPDGTAKVGYERLRFGTLMARDPKSGQMGVADQSPAALTGGEAVVRLAPVAQVRVTARCDDKEDGGKPVDDTINASLETPTGQRVAQTATQTRELTLPVPPGDYRLRLYGSKAIGQKLVAVTVPPGRAEVVVPPIDLTATGRHRVVGKPAPPLEGVVGWKGTPVRLDDLKGKVVVLEFFGYWCGPCVATMPEIMRVHDELSAEGVVVIGVHVDADGEVATPADLDAKLAHVKKTLWKGRDLPFPVALVSGKDDAAGPRNPVAAFAVSSYPTTIVIGPDGQVVGDLQARDAAGAILRLREVLAGAKK